MATTVLTPEEREVRQAYADTLADLKANSRPIIVALTELANEYKQKFAHAIVLLIEERLRKVSSSQKLPCLYLMDSIVKNHPIPYKELFQQNIVTNFCNAFLAIDDLSVRASMYKLRTTWKDVFDPTKLYQLDVKMQRECDQKWPVAPLPQNVTAPTSGKILVNPSVFGRKAVINEDAFNEEFLRKQQELKELKMKRLEMELAAEKKLLEEAAKGNATKAVKAQEKEVSSLNKTEEESKKGRDPRVRRHKSREPSPRPTSSSSKASSRGSASPKEKSSVPPPPTIRGEFKSNSAPLKPAAAISRPGAAASSSNEEGEEYKAKLGKKRKAHLPSSNGKKQEAPLKEDSRPSSSSPGTSRSDRNMRQFKIPKKAAGQKEPARRSPPRDLDNHDESSHGGPHQRPAQGAGRETWQASKRRGGLFVQVGRDKQPRLDFQGSIEGVDPHIVESEVIPMIVQKAKEGLSSGSLNQEQFSVVMQQVQRLKVQAIAQLEESSRQAHGSHGGRGGGNSGGGVGPIAPWARPNHGGPSPWIRPPMGMPMPHHMSRPPPPFMRPPFFGDGLGPRMPDIPPHGFVHPMERMPPPIREYMPAHADVEMVDAREPYVEHAPQPAAEGHVDAAPAHAGPAAGPSPTVNVHDLWSQLLGAGLISTDKKASIPGLDANTPMFSAAAESSMPESTTTEKGSVTAAAADSSSETKVKDEKSDAHSEVFAVIKPITLTSHHSSLKERQSAIVHTLFNTSAQQCKNCGLRYSSSSDDAASSYSQHLDWHFRMRRREKENARRAQSRKWYFQKDEWIISEEIEDKEKEDLSDPEHKPILGEGEVPTVPTEDNSETEGTCPTCKEKFDQFFKQDDDDHDGGWHYRNAIRVQDPRVGSRVFHPQCYEDFKANDVSLSSTFDDSNNLDALNESEAEEEEEDSVSRPIQMEESVSEAVKEEDPTESTAEPEADEPMAEGTPQDKVKEEVPEEEEESPAVKEEVDTPMADAAEADSEMPETTSDGSPKAEVKEEPADHTDESVLDVGDSLVAPSAAPKASIKINITTQVEKLERRESVISTKSETENSEFDEDAVVQPAKPEQEDLKPKMKTVKFTVIPPREKGSELSGLCSIM